MLLAGRALGGGVAYTWESLPNARDGVIALLGSLVNPPYVRRTSAAVIASKNLRPTALVSARQLAGVLSWEVDILRYTLGAEDHAVDALTMLSKVIGLRKGRSVFMRLRREEEFRGNAHKGGFFTSYEQTLFERTFEVEIPAQDMFGSLKQVGHEDAFPLFRLYCAATPSKVRSHQGMTFEMWASSREPSRRDTEEWVFYSDNMARGWVRTAKRGLRGELELMVHPDDEVELTRRLLDFSLSRFNVSQKLYMMTAEYQVVPARLAAQRGFRACSDFSVLAKSLSVKERLDETSPLTVVSR